MAPGEAPHLVVALRRDLGEAPFQADVSVCAPSGEGLGDLARAIRRAIVPDQALEDPGPWKFWDR